MQHRFDFPVRLFIGDDGSILVTFPDFPEASTAGAYEREALIEASDCLEEAITRCIRRQEEIPSPSPALGCQLVAPGPMTLDKAAQYLAKRHTSTP